MSKIYIISDTHFGHENILKFRDSKTNELIRNFSDIHDMNEHIVQRWNAVVTEEDIVYHLGDVYFGKGWEVLERLKGRKRLILGNHDNAKSEHLQKYFQKILMWRMFPEYNCLLTHVPVHESALEFRNLKNIHGHIHQNTTMITNPDGSRSPDLRYINVSVEKTDYTPINIESLI
jgi:calcineurin-like phosphoesterase family protein